MGNYASLQSRYTLRNAYFNKVPEDILADPPMRGIKVDRKVMPLLNKQGFDEHGRYHIQIHSADKKRQKDVIDIDAQEGTSFI